jgi:hypothetical protein
MMEPTALVVGRNKLILKCLTIIKINTLKTINIISAILIVAGIISFSACNKDDDPAKPVITLTELGYDNSKISYAGDELHIEADIVAEGKIDKVTVEIHSDSGHEGKNTVNALFEWEVDTVYTEFYGLKNTEFHKHLDIPAEADTGHYHFHFIVTDLEGQQTTVEEEIEIRLPLLETGFYSPL